MIVDLCSVITSTPVLVFLSVCWAIGCDSLKGKGCSDVMSDEQTIVLTVKVLEENGFVKDPEGFYSNSMISFKKLCDILGCEAKDFGLTMSESRGWSV